MTVQHCKYCGRDNEPSAAFCSGCGTELAAASEAEEGLLGQETSDWLLKTFGWALEQFGGDSFYKRTRLITPTEVDFPDVTQAGVDVAEGLFRRVIFHAGMESWPCKLVAQKADRSPHIAPTIILANVPQGPGGTFLASARRRGPAVITYNPSELGDPQSLVAVFAHELAHYLGHGAAEPPPGGPQNWEKATDLLAVFMGFGIFLANSAIRFGQFTGVKSQGWRISRSGYLSDTELVFALAIFCLLKGIERKQASRHLKPWLGKALRNAVDELVGRSSEMELLRSIPLVTRPRSRNRLRRWDSD